MSRKLPIVVRTELKQIVATLADEHRYLERSAVDNTAFLDTLVRHPKVGQRIQEFMGPTEVRHYIKDALLNKYAKQKRKAPQDVGSFVGNFCPQHPSLVEKVDDGNVSLYRCENGDCVVLANATYGKWEVGLRKALTYVAKNEALRQLPRSKVRLVLLLLLHGRATTEADKKIVERALDFVGVSYQWVP